jgi:hypothetical protein
MWICNNEEQCLFAYLDTFYYSGGELMNSTTCVSLKFWTVKFYKTSLFFIFTCCETSLLILKGLYLL